MTSIRVSVCKILSPILMAMCPLLAIGYFIYIFNSILNGNGSNDAIGWTLLFLIVVGIGILPLVGGATVPFVVFLVTIKKKQGLKLSIPLFSISNVFFAIELFTIYKLEGPQAGSSIFYYAIWIIYAVISVFCILSLNSQIIEE